MNKPISICHLSNCREDFSSRTAEHKVCNNTNDLFRVKSISMKSFKYIIHYIPKKNASNHAECTLIKQKKKAKAQSVWFSTWSSQGGNACSPCYNGKLSHHNDQKIHEGLLYSIILSMKLLRRRQGRLIVDVIPFTCRNHCVCTRKRVYCIRDLQCH